MGTVVSVAVAIFKAIAAIPQIIEYCKEFAAAITVWYVERQDRETYSKLADAAAFAARANSPEERSEALDRWRTALSRPRYIK
jgi:hypothetical protein